MNIQSVKVNEHIYYIGVNDRQTNLFENMWPLPDGVSYNSFILKGEKTALMDTVRINKVEIFLEKLKGVLGDKSPDYLIIHHMEPDHSGSIKQILELFPEIKIVGNKKTTEFLKDYYDIEDGIEIVAEGDELDLGGVKLKFFMTPMVHWPESMVSYEETTKTLFSQDAFGGFGTLNGPIFDDQINYDFYKDETVRYYTNIVGKFSKQVQNALKKLSALDIKCICPVHGPIWRTNPSYIIDLYRSLAEYEVEDGIVLVYGSMYGNTERMVEAVARGLTEKGVKNIRIHDVSKTHLSYLIADIWRYKGIVLGSCTYNNSLFPPMKVLVDAISAQKMKNHVIGVFGSYGWSGGAVKALREFAESSDFPTAETVVEAKGSATEADIEACMQLGREMADLLKK